MPIKILPCPYCGNKEPELEILPTTDCRQRIMCRECITIGPLIIGEDFEAVRIQAIEAWNALPRRLRWTKERPTEEGVYWYRDEFLTPFTLTRVFRDREKKMKVYGVRIIGTLNLYEMPGEWAGPIPEPVEE